MYISRHLENEVIEASKGYPVVMVTGPRQVGKTTMLKKLASEDGTSNGELLSGTVRRGILLHFTQ